MGERSDAVLRTAMSGGRLFQDHALWLFGRAIHDPIITLKTNIPLSAVSAVTVQGAGFPARHKAPAGRQAVF
jgi:hypothetical protein